MVEVVAFDFLSTFWPLDAKSIKEPEDWFTFSTMLHLYHPSAFNNPY